MSVRSDKHSSALLGDMTPKQFMAAHWQKRWRLMRGALPEFKELVDVKTLWALAGSSSVESRLIIRDGKNWKLESGPFNKKRSEEHTSELQSPC